MKMGRGTATIGLVAFMAKWMEEKKDGKGQGDLISTLLMCFVLIMGYVIIYIAYTLFGFWKILPLLLLMIVATILFIRGVIE